jgi:putative acetyltransferase
VVESSPSASAIELRVARDSDAAGIIALIGGAYAEYAGCVLDVESEEPDLLAIATAYARRGGNFWVAVNSNEVVGCIGWAPRQQGWIELKKLYVSAAHRRQGIATQLLALVEAAASEHRVTALELWSDTRFLEGHHFYRANGFVQQPETRELFDLSETTEYRFVKLFGP